jgi:hypothetical protein
MSTNEVSSDLASSDAQAYLVVEQAGTQLPS